MLNGKELWMEIINLRNQIGSEDWVVIGDLTRLELQEIEKVMRVLIR